MSRITEIRSSVADSTPVYAAVGATDLAVEKLREAGDRAKVQRDRLVQQRAELAQELKLSQLQAKAGQAFSKELHKQVARVTKLAEQAQHVPAIARDRGVAIAGESQETYTELVERGEQLVKRIRTQKATKDLLAQAENTVALGKGYVTSVRKAIAELERSAKATVTLTRKQVAETVEALETAAVNVTEAVSEAATEAVEQESKVAAETVHTSATQTSAAAKRTATTARKAAARTTAKAKAATTSARTTAKAGTKATKKAAEKVGD